MILFTNGCSFTCGTELENPEKDAWPYKLKILLKTKNLINFAKPGASNDYIVRSTCNFIINNLKNLNNIFFIIGLTVHDRFEIYNYEQSQYNDIIVYGDETKYNLHNYDATIINYINKYFKNNINLYINKINNIITLYLIFKHFNIKYLFFEAIEDTSKYLNLKYINFINDLTINNLINIKNKLNNMLYETYINQLILYKQINIRNFITNISFKNFCVKNKYSFGPYGHPLEEAHQAWAEYLYKYIMDNKILEDQEE
jgi:hypothetical protein